MRKIMWLIMKREARQPSILKRSVGKPMLKPPAGNPCMLSGSKTFYLEGRVYSAF